MKTLIRRILRALLVLLFLGVVIPASAVQITFQVNMNVQTNLGTFDPALHTVHVAGSFSGWTSALTLQPKAGATNIYEGTLEIAGSPGETIQFKFLINQSGTELWEGNVGPNNTANRVFTLPATNQVLRLVYFNNEGTGVPIPVTFRVNMGVQDDIGQFDPAADFVEVRGVFNGWSAGFQLAQSQTDTNLYEGVADMTTAPGSVIDYKFVIVRADTSVSWEGNVGSGGGSGNRQFVLDEAAAQVLPAAYFNNLTNNPGAGIPVTFKVNLLVQVARGVFDPAAGTVTVAGPFNSWSTTAWTLTNNPADPYIYSGTSNITTLSPGASVAYKFVANGGTWESGGNRIFTLAASAQELPTEFFDRLDNLGPITLTPDSPEQITASWIGGPLIRLQTNSILSGAWQDVPDTLNTSTISVPPTDGQQFFRLISP